MLTLDRNSQCRLAALGLATEGAVRMAVLLDLPDLLSDHGLHPDAVIRAMGCDPALFQDADNTIAFSAVGRLLEHAAVATGCRCPGIELGRSKGLNVIGAVGRAARLAPNIGSALRVVTLNLHLHDRGAIPYLWTSGDQALFGYALYCSDIVGAGHIYDGALAISNNIIRELAGPDWCATEIRLFREAPEDITPYRAHFRTQLRFAAPQAAIVFPKADLSRPCVDADADRFVLALRDLESLDAAFGGGLTHKVRRLLMRLMVAGAFLSDLAPDRAAIARLMGLHPRSLNRRLRAEGSTFAGRLAESRYAIARELLRDTRLPIDAIAALLGYAETASFGHAFRRWSSSTATAWRSRFGQ
jgi:AraC-like DNA-binding protein